MALLISWEKKSRERDKKSLMRRGENFGVGRKTFLVSFFLLLFPRFANSLLPPPFFWKATSEPSFSPSPLSAKKRRKRKVSPDIDFPRCLAREKTFRCLGICRRRDAVPELGGKKKKKHERRRLDPNKFYKVAFWNKRGEALH